MTPKEILIAARAKIADPKHWTQGAFARNMHGHTSLTPETAVCWCAIGAVNAVADTLPDIDMWDHQHALDKLQASTYFNTVAFNDTHTHAEVLAAFDKAIACAG